MNPIKQFSDWYFKEVQVTKAKLSGACCLSTIGADGFPNSRFLSLKGIKNDCFIITGSYASRKGVEITDNNKIALTFWWPCTERQVRVQGNAIKISRQDAENYFVERNRESQIVSTVSEQGRECYNYDSLMELYKKTETEFADVEIPCPQDWGGFSIAPIRIEFLEFSNTRFHHRELFLKTGDKWERKYLQP